MLQIIMLAVLTSLYFTVRLPEPIRSTSKRPFGLDDVLLLIESSLQTITLPLTSSPQFTCCLVIDNFANVAISCTYLV
uniref:Secreted protein n=1 Tax=Anguilla anguilla TaxID=7936 RepID=A0A0E9Q3G3_ANGAN